MILLRRFASSALLGTGTVCCCLALTTLAWGAGDRPDETLSIPPQPHRLANAQSVAFSLDGKRVAAGFGGAGTGRLPIGATSGGVAVWEIETGKRLLWSPIYGDLIRLGFLHAGSVVFFSRVYTPGDSVDDNQISLVEVLGGKQVQKWEGYACAASPLRRQVVVQQGRGKLQALGGSHFLPADAIDIVLKDGRDAECLAVTDDGKLLVAVHAVLEPIIRPDGTVWPGSKRIVRKGLTVLDADTFRPVRTARIDTLVGATALAVSRQAKLIATGHPQGVVRVFDGQTLEELHTLHGSEKSSAFPAFSPDGKELAVLSQPVNAIAWSYAPAPSGFAFTEQAADRLCELIIYETKTFTPVRQFEFADGAFRVWHAGGAKASRNPQRLAWSPDGKQLLVGANGVVLLDALTGQVVRQFDTE
ncbi:WD40 repeat domain-containing protein [Lignipirellula cremea]|uniref:WD domain, G-beta repeat n=1 Tax=Lignipirellula cremea TaxID=2528010 RepID=A0A518DY49_9BACT|nr:hypothetical protein [Lignipirellula cremea]QDU96754.1 hypothetical protein Pla8534_45750 [Lignipirellula cremea]